MSNKYKFQPEVHTKLVNYLKSKSFEDVGQLLPKIMGDENSEFEQDDVIVVLNYMVNRPYFEVQDLLSKIFPLTPVNANPEVVEPAVMPEVASTPEETSIIPIKKKKKATFKK